MSIVEWFRRRRLHAIIIDVLFGVLLFGNWLLTTTFSFNSLYNGIITTRVPSERETRKMEIETLLKRSKSKAVFRLWIYINVGNTRFYVQNNTYIYKSSDTYAHSHMHDAINSFVHCDTAIVGTEKTYYYYYFFFYIILMRIQIYIFSYRSYERKFFLFLLSP